MLSSQMLDHVFFGVERQIIMPRERTCPSRLVVDLDVGLPFLSRAKQQVWLRAVLDEASIRVHVLSYMLTVLGSVS